MSAQFVAPSSLICVLRVCRVSKRASEMATDEKNHRQATYQRTTRWNDLFGAYLNVSQVPLSQSKNKICCSFTSESGGLLGKKKGTGQQRRSAFRTTCEGLVIDGDAGLERSNMSDPWDRHDPCAIFGCRIGRVHSSNHHSFVNTQYCRVAGWPGGLGGS